MEAVCGFSFALLGPPSARRTSLIAAHCIAVLCAFIFLQTDAMKVSHTSRLIEVLGMQNIIQCVYSAAHYQANSPSCVFSWGGKNASQQRQNFQVYFLASQMWPSRGGNISNVINFPAIYATWKTGLMRQCGLLAVIRLSPAGKTDASINTHAN